MSLEQRVTELEVKLSYAEDLLDELNRVVYRQQAQIDGLVRQLGALAQQVSELEPPQRRDPRDPRDELPPHY